MLDLDSILEILKGSKDKGIKDKLKLKKNELTRKYTRICDNLDFTIENFSSPGHGYPNPEDVKNELYIYFSLSFPTYYSWCIADNKKVKSKLEDLLSECKEIKKMLDILS